MLAALLIAAVLGSSTEPAPGPSRFSLAVEGGGSLLEPSLHTALEAGLRIGAPRLLLRAEWNPWITLQEPGANANRGVANLALGAEFFFFEERMRTAVFLGASTLLFQSAFDPPGTFGPMLGVVPASFRKQLTDRLFFRFDPLSLFILMPSLGSIPLVVIQYRHGVALEFSL